MTQNGEIVGIGLKSEGPVASHMSMTTDDTTPRYQGNPEPLCPHGCFKRKPMRWVDDQWYCPKCRDEFVADYPYDRTWPDDR